MPQPTRSVLTRGRLQPYRVPDAFRCAAALIAMVALLAPALAIAQSTGGDAGSTLWSAFRTDKALSRRFDRIRGYGTSSHGKFLQPNCAMRPSRLKCVIAILTSTHGCAILFGQHLVFLKLLHKSGARNEKLDTCAW
jgi:hypothetical protein